MGPAELKALRERLGLSTRWLAERWGVRELTVKRWEHNRVAPEDVVADMHHLVDVFWAAAGELAASDVGVLSVPRTDATVRDEWPAMWHRAVALAAGKPLVFVDESERLGFTAEGGGS